MLNITKLFFTMLIFLTVVGCGQQDNVLPNSSPQENYKADELQVEESRIESIPTETPYRGNMTPEPITYSEFTTKTSYGDVYKWNGYYYRTEGHTNNKWIPGIPTYDTQFLYMPLLSIGDAWAYGPNLMEATAKFHGLTLDDVEDGITVPFCSMIGSYVWVKRPYNEGILGTGEWEGPYKVVDCAGVKDLYNVVVHRDEVIEIGFETARRWTMVKDFKMTGENTSEYMWDFRKVKDVIVSFIPPECITNNMIPTNLDDWFVENMEFYKSQEDFDNAYQPLPRTYKQILQHPEWRFEKNGEWIEFELNNYNDFCSEEQLKLFEDKGLLERK